MPFKKPWYRLPESRRTILDLDFRALVMRKDFRDFWIPVGHRSKERFQRAVYYNPEMPSHLRIRGDALTLLQIHPRSVSEGFFPAFLRLARARGFTIYARNEKGLFEALNPVRSQTYKRIYG